MTRRIVLALLVSLALVGGLAGPASAAKPHRGVVLGSKSLYQPYGEGWGTKHPRTVYNGGVPSGSVTKIKWKHWGKKTARGYGKGNQYRPEGGYYATQVKVQFKAKKIGRCSKHGPRAYTKLYARFQNKPGGKFGKWFRWAGLKNICSEDYDF